MTIEKQTVFEKTPKGINESQGRWGIFLNKTQKVLSLVDGKLTVGELVSKSGMKEQKLIPELETLLQERLIRETWTPVDQFSVNVSPGEHQGIHVTVANTQAYMEAMNKQKPKEEEELISLDDIEEKLLREAEQLAKREEAERQFQIEAKVREESERKAKEEAERLAREEEERRAREGAERLAREEAERKAREAEEQRAREEAERKAKEEAERLAREDAERKAREEEERRAREEAERQAKEEAERLAREEEERRAREEAERLAREEAERQAREEEARRAREEAERKAKEEAERLAREEEERRVREEAERLAREEAERKAREAEEQRAREEAERKAREEAERLAREDAERKAREEEERRAREEAERKAKEEAERLAREEAERKEKEEAERKAREERIAKRLKAREEEERRASEEAERKAREETERLAREEEERRAREEAERLAREDAERKAREEEERRAREEAERKEKEEAERLAREEEERRAREEAERLAREEAERKAREEEEQRAREEADRLAHEEDERQAREEERRAREAAELKVREAEEKRAREAVERQAKEDAERQAKQEKEQRAREESERKVQEKAERKAREEAEKQAKLEAKRLAREQAVPGETMEKLLPWIKWGGAGILGLLLVALAAIHFVPLGSSQKALEKLASSSLGEPVKMASLNLALFPSPHLKLRQVQIGSQGALQIADARIYAGWGTLFGSGHQVERIELEKVELAAGTLESAASWPARNASQPAAYQIAQVVLRNIQISAGASALPLMKGEFNFSPAGSLEKSWLGSEDGSLRADFSPSATGQVVSVSVKDMMPLSVLPLKIDSLQAGGTISGKKLHLAEVTGTSHGGKMSGSLTLSWDQDWSVSGDVHITSARLAPPAKESDKLQVSGQLDASLSFFQQAKTLELLFKQPLLNGSVTLREGAVHGFDLPAALHYEVEAIYSGQTAYDSWSFKLESAGENQGYRAMRMAGKGLLIEGKADVSTQGAISGMAKLQVEGKKKTTRGNYNLGGTLERPVIRRVP